MLILEMIWKLRSHERKTNTRRPPAINHRAPRIAQKDHWRFSSNLYKIEKMIISVNDNLEKIRVQIRCSLLVSLARNSPESCDLFVLQANREKRGEGEELSRIASCSYLLSFRNTNT